ncbi:MAG: CHASE3 domain-containing protein, partial [Bryobacteraceae bacterium]
MPLSLRHRMDRPWRFLAIAILLVLVVLFYSDWRAFQSATRDAGQTRQILQATHALLASLTDAENGQRGYLLTGDRRYLTPFESAEAKLPVELRDLSAAAAASSRYLPDVARVETLTREKLAEVKQTIAARDHESPAAALAIVRTDHGQRTMGEIRSICSTIMSAETESLTTRSREAEHHANRFRSIVLLGCLLLAFLLFRLGSAVDTVIADRERFASSADEARQQLQTTLSSIGDAVIATDTAGAIRFMNPVAETLTGWSSDDALVRPLEGVFHIVHESTRAMVESPVRKVLREGAVTGLANHTVLLAKGGGEIPIDDSGAPIRDRHGKMLGVVLVFRDISERRTAEQELERWKQIFIHAGFGMFVVGPRDDKIEDLNQAFAALHGDRVEELRGRRLAELAAPEFRDQLSAALKLAAEKGRHLLEVNHLRRDGTEFVCLMDITAIRSEKG